MNTKMFSKVQNHNIMRYKESEKALKIIAVICHEDINIAETTF